MRKVERSRQARWAALFVWIGLVGPTLLSAIACGRAKAPEEMPRATPPENRLARWAYHPTRPTAVLAELSLPDGSVLGVTAAGTRTLRQGGQMESSAFAAPEPLIEARLGADGVRVIGRSGSVYHAKDPLGPFQDVTTPRADLASTLLHRGQLISVTRNGELYLADENGNGGRSITPPGFLVAAVPQGEGLLLFTVPEQAYFLASPDAPAVPLPDFLSIGIGGSRSSDHQILLRGAFSDYELEGDQLRAARSTPEPKRWAPSATRMLASKLVAGEATWIGDQAFQIGASASGPIGSGRFDEDLKPREELKFPDCHAAKIASSEKYLAVVCALEPLAATTSPRLALFLGKKGTALSPLSASLRGQVSRLLLHLDDNGELLLHGVCAPAASELGCQPRGLFRISAKRPELYPLSAFPMREVHGIQKVDSSWVVLGKEASSGQRVIQVVPPDGGPQQWKLDRVFGSGGEAVEPSVLLPAQDGRFLVIASARGRRQFLYTNTRLERLGRGELPTGVDAVSGEGPTLVALDAEASLLWVSHDAGLTMERVGLPQELCADPRRKCEVDLVCRKAACLVGDELAWIGLDGVTPASISPPSVRRSALLPTERFASSYTCDLSQQKTDLSDLAKTPTVVDAALGSAAFVAMTSDIRTAQVNSVAAAWDSPQIERRVLLPPLRDASEYALSVLGQVEGGAALRYRQPSGRGDPNLREVVVAWDNRITRAFGSAQLAAEIPYRPGDFEERTHGVAKARPELLSVSADGIYVKVNGPGNRRQPIYFVSSTLVEKLAPPTVPPVVEKFADELVRIGGRHVPLVWTDETRLLLWAFHLGEPLEPMSLLPPAELFPDYSSHTGIAYRLEEPLIFAYFRDEKSSREYSFGVPFERGSKPFPLPTLTDLGSSVRTCSPLERQSTPRVVTVAPALKYARVTVFDGGGGTRVFRTRRAVLHGERSGPCVAAFEAFPESEPEGAASESLLLFPGHQTAWFFREERRSDGPRRLSAAVASCVSAQVGDP